MARYNGCPECQTSYGEESGSGSGSKSHVEERQAERRDESQENTGRHSPVAIFNPYYTGRPRTPANGSKPLSMDRQEIIRKIKSGVSRPTSPELERPMSRSSLKKRKSPTPEQPRKTLLEQRPKSPEVQQDNQAIGLQIERPRSAFHTGDFREKEPSTSGFERFGDAARDEPAPILSTSPVAPWHPDFPTMMFRRPNYTPATPPGLPVSRHARSRAVSNASLATSFTYKPPTSPLVQASRPDTPEPPTRHSSRSPDKSRRHTFSPQALQRFGSALEYPTSARSYGHKNPPTLRAEQTFPYQAHQPRRSLNSFASLPQSPAVGPRRPSFSETPLHHAPMVGSYEESILRGRMSTTPSKPLNFVAQIGVLGKGNCKPNLRCPPHATVPFPAVFYSYGTGSKYSESDQPSPYVGLVDLENNLPAVTLSPEKRKHRVQAAVREDQSRSSSVARGENSASDAHERRRRRQKEKRRSRSPKALQGGSYRIPQQGQLQIIIKNPNKTAVKLFLIPYDLSDMEAGQKTFIRQRSYSAGPIIDMPMSSRKNLGTDRPEAALNSGDDPNERPMLRYLVHLHICCPSKGRYYLHKSIRVVFANRVPDGKEKLRNEIQLPEPKYSAYKPGRDSNVGLAGSTTPKIHSRRRSVIDVTETMPSTPWLPNRRFLAQSLPTTDYNARFSDSISPMQPLPFALPTLESRPASRQMSESMEIDSEFTPETQDSRSAFPSPTSRGGEEQGMRRLEDPFVFERGRGPGARSESLLSRKLRGLGFRPGGVEEREGL